MFLGSFGGKVTEMRFVVDLYRVILIAALAGALMFGTYLVVVAFGAGDNGTLGGIALFSLITVAIMVVLGIGVTAAFVSIHDRIAEISESADKIVAALDRIAEREGRP